MYHEKYLKYKKKYLDLLNEQNDSFNNENEPVDVQYGGLDPEYIMDVVELYDKTYNLYVMYRFRYNNTLPIIKSLYENDEKNHLTELSTHIEMIKKNKMIKQRYDQYYIPNILQMPVETIITQNPANILFTLRQDTTKVILHLLLVNEGSLAKINEYLQLVVKIVYKQTDRTSKYYRDLLEISSKCTQISGLVSPGKMLLKTPYIKDQDQDQDKMTGLRVVTNRIINIIGNSNNTEILDDKGNTYLDTAFKRCFQIIYEILIKNVGSETPYQTMPSP